MLRTICRKKLQLLVLTLIMSAFLTFTTSFAFGKESTTSTSIVTPTFSFDYTSTSKSTICSSSALIKASTGGILYLSGTMGLYVPAYAYSKDIVLTASFVYNPKKNTIEFNFGPSPTTFNVPLQLFMSWYDLNNFGLPGNPPLYYAGVPVACSVSDWGITYYLDHFSIYYFARR